MSLIHGSAQLRPPQATFSPNMEGEAALIRAETRLLPPNRQIHARPPYEKKQPHPVFHSLSPFPGVRRSLIHAFAREILSGIITKTVHIMPRSRGG